MATRTPSPDSSRKRDTVSELPDGAPDATGLTPRQQRVLRVIKESIDERGYPPSMREIGKEVGLTSPRRWPTSYARWRRRATSSATPTALGRYRYSTPRRCRATTRSPEES